MPDIERIPGRLPFSGAVGPPAREEGFTTAQTAKPDYANLPSSRPEVPMMLPQPAQPQPPDRPYPDVQLHSYTEAVKPIGLEHAVDLSSGQARLDGNVVKLDAGKLGQVRSIIAQAISEQLEAKAKEIMKRYGPNNVRKNVKSTGTVEGSK